MAFLVPLILPSVIDATANVGKSSFSSSLLPSNPTIIAFQHVLYTDARLAPPTALGITNAIQGTSSSVTFQIGNRVYTSSKGFPFQELPEEIREEIILIALEGSKELIQQSLLVPRPFALQPTAIPLKNTLADPSDPHYRSIRGEWRVVNGYPVSAWLWCGVAREWRDVLRRKGLWRCTVVDSGSSYRRFLKFLDEGVIDDVLPGIRSLELDQGFEDPSDLYRIILQPRLSNLRSLAIVPCWPFSSNMTVPPARFFKFGLQLLPVPPAKTLRLTARDDDDDDYSPAVNSDTDHEDEGDSGKQGVKRKRLHKLALGLPLDLSTNAVSRQHLRLLRSKRLEITLLLRLHAELFTELADLLEGNTDELCIRFLASDQTHELCNPREIVVAQLDRFKKVDIHLPALTSSAMNRPYQGQQDRHTSFADHVVNLIALDEERRKRYTVWVEQPERPDGPMGPMGGLGAGWLKPQERVAWERQVDVAEGAGRRDVLFVDDQDEREQSKSELSSIKQGKQPAYRNANTGSQAAGGSGTEHWERETHLKLLGGLLSLRLESKKH